MLIEAYRKCLTALTHCHSGFTDGEQPITLSMCGHSVDTIRYCVSQEKVSIHLPVSRLLAGRAPGAVDGRCYLFFSTVTTHLGYVSCVGQKELNILLSNQVL